MVVVVIIIGILASIGLINYIRAVEKARWSEARAILGLLRAAQIKYCDQYGAYVTDETYPFEALDVEFTPPKYFTFLVWGNPGALAQATRNNVGNYFTGFYVQISKDGDFAYVPWHPDWLK